jgi:hypothetical protein
MQLQVFAIGRDALQWRRADFNVLYKLSIHKQFEKRYTELKVLAVRKTT